MKRIVAAALALAVNAANAYAQESAAQVYLLNVRSGLLEIINQLRELNGTTKAGVLAALAAAAVLIYLRNRDTPANSVRKARNLHQKAVELHQKGKEELAREYYEQASRHREKSEALQ